MSRNNEKCGRRSPPSCCIHKRNSPHLVGLFTTHCPPHLVMRISSPIPLSTCRATENKISADPNWAEMYSRMYINKNCPVWRPGCNPRILPHSSAPPGTRKLLPDSIGQLVQRTFSLMPFSPGTGNSYREYSGTAGALTSILFVLPLSTSLGHGFHWRC